ncbi:MAG TPA: hypothetical protein VGV89_06775 [Thermoplasmata archaeon]|nr:hypothetical protein [Thermoplasmata archaeon]
MQRRTATRVLALTVLLLASSGVFVAHASTSVSGSTSHASVAVHPSASDRVYTTSRYGGYDADFGPGLSNGRIFFYAYDPTDKYAQVTLVDPNSSRDGVANPAMTWNVSFSASSGYTNYSYQWNGSYEIPFALVHGGWWNLTIRGSTAGNYSFLFRVDTYDAYLNPDAYVYLPGHPANVSYLVRARVNGAPFSSIQSVEASATYTNTASKVVSVFSTSSTSFPATWAGSIKFTMPTDVLGVGVPAVREVLLQLWVNQTSAGGTWSVYTYYYLEEGTLYTQTLSLAACLTCGSTSTFQSGQIAYLQLIEGITNGQAYPTTAPAAGLNVRFTFEAAGSIVPAVPGNPPLTGTTNSTGGIAILFIANSTVFSTTKANTIVINVTDPADVHNSANFTGDFNVLPASQGIAVVSVKLDSSNYYGGDTLTATWTIGGTTAAAATGWQVDSYIIYNDNTGAILGVGTLNTTATSASFTWPIPASYVGGLDVYVYAHNATNSQVGTAYAVVTAPYILLSASEYGYNPGDSITISVTTEGQVFSGATLYGSVTASTGGSLFSGVVSGTSFSVTIPKVGTPSYLYVTVAAQTSTAGVITSSEVELEEISGISISSSLQTASHYDDGSYQPGETVQIAFTISAHGNAVLGKAFIVDAYADTTLGYQGKSEVETTSTSGTLSFTIPSSDSNGAQLVYVEATVVGCESGCYSYSSVSIPVESSPPALGYELGTGTGVTVGWVILLVLIIVVAIVLLLKMRGGRRTVMMSPVEATGTSSSSPSSPSSGGGSAPSSPSSGEASSGSPPLPTPPSH